MPGSPTVAYTYDALGRPLARTDGTTSETYSYLWGHHKVGDQLWAWRIAP